MDVINLKKIKDIRTQINNLDDKQQETKLKITEVDKELNDFQKTLSNVNVNQEVKQTVTGYGVASLPKNAANGQVSTSVKGNTYTQLVDGRFALGWTGDVIVSNQVATLPADGTTQFARYTFPTAFTIGDKIALFLTITENTLNAGLLKANGHSGSDFSGTYFFTDVTIGRKMLIIDVTIAGTLLDLSINETSISGSIKFTDVMCINLTQAGLVAKTPTEMLSMIPRYLMKGTKSTISAGRLKSVNKQLIDEDRLLKSNGFIKNTEGYYVLLNATVFNKVIWENKNNYNGQIVVEIKAKSTGTNLGSFPIIRYTDETYIGVDYTNGIGFNIKRIVSSSDKTVKNIIWGYTTNTSSTTVEYLYVSKGINSPYELHQHSELYYSAKDNNGNIVELRSLPNGTKDEVRFNQSTGQYEHVKRVSDKYVVQSVDITDLNIEQSTVDWVRINKKIDDVLYNNSTTNLVTSQTKNIKGFTPGTFYTNGVPYTHINYSTTQFMVGVPKGTYANLAAAKTALTGLALTYQLATPIITPIETSGTLLSYPSGTVYVEQATADAGMYTDKFAILQQDLPIAELEKISKVDFMTGVETELDVSLAVIASDKLSFTHPNLTADDLVFVTYFFDIESTKGELTVEYYDSRYVLKDSVTNKYYKIVQTVGNGVLTQTLVEV